MDDTTISVSELVGLINQTLDYAYPVVNVEGEVANFKISKNKWIYFDLKDDSSNVRFFGSVYNLKTPIEDGMMIRVLGNPRLHNLYGFSVTVQNIELAGEGTIKRAQELLKINLEKEGLFDQSRKRSLPKYPTKIGLITSAQAAAYSDFLKIINQRWSGLEILHADVQVQGDKAVDQIVSAINKFSEASEPVDVLVIIRGGGSPEDLSAFSTEPVVRAVAGSRIPTIVGIGHESDISLAELASDMRASTPTNAAQLVVPDKTETIASIDYFVSKVASSINNSVSDKNHRINLLLQRMEAGLDRPKNKIDSLVFSLEKAINSQLNTNYLKINSLEKSLSTLNPKAVLKRGYSMVRSGSKIVHSSSNLKIGDTIVIEFEKGKAGAEVTDVQ